VITTRGGDEVKASTRLSRTFLLLGALSGLTGGLATTPAAFAASAAEEGRKLAENRKKGNCVSCHAYEGANLPGNVGPPLVAMKARFPDKAVLRAQIYDATKSNPQTMMPPFGLHGVLTADEINKVVEWVYTL
jgi:sulfur-oxidizing protein SoxX